MSSAPPVVPEPVLAPVQPGGLGELAALDAVGSVITIERDGSLFQEGDPADHYFKVVRGAIRTCKLLSNGRRHVGNFFLPGEFIALNAPAIHVAGAEAIGATVLVRYERRRVDVLLAANSGLAASLVARLSTELAASQRRTLLLSRMTAPERIATFLIEMMTRGHQAQRGLIGLPMTRADVGDYLGLTTETVCRGIAQLKRAGVVAAYGPHELRVLRRDLLQKIADCF